MATQVQPVRVMSRRRPINPANVIPYVLLLALIVALVSLQPNLFKISWLERKTDSTLTLIFAVIGQTLVILVGGIDLSIGGVISLTNSIAATHFTEGPDMLVWIVIILAIGLLAGAIN